MKMQNVAITVNRARPMRRHQLLSLKWVALLILAAFAWVPSSWGVDTICHTANYAPTKTNWRSDLRVRQFDPSIGTLQKVVVTATAHGTTELCLENLNDYAIYSNLDAHAVLDVIIVDPTTGQNIVTTTAEAYVAMKRIRLLKFDGVLDYLGTSGRTVPVAPANSNRRELVPGDVGFDDFKGVGTTSFPVAANGGSSGTCSGNAAFEIKTYGAATITVCYVYEPEDHNGPKPALVKTAEQSIISTCESTTVKYDIAVINTGDVPLSNVVVQDDNGTPLDLLDDLYFIMSNDQTQADGVLDPQEVWPISYERTLPGMLCTTIDGVNVVAGTLVTEVLESGDVKVTFRQSRNISDNTYGANAVGYSSGHTFSQLLGSDKAQIRFTDARGAVVLEFIADYVSADPAAPSGYGTLGVSGGDGKMVIGSAASVKSVKTTISDNLNQSPLYYGYTVDSPPPPEPFPGWDYEVGYEVIIDGAVFGVNGLGSVSIVAVHNSPPKIGDNALIPLPCDYCVVNTARVTADYVGQTEVQNHFGEATSSVQVCVTGANCSNLKQFLGDRVWHDANKNGIQDLGEAGVPDVTVELYNAADNSFVARTKTDDYGWYGFAPLPGDYRIKFLPPEGFVITTPNAGTDDAADSDADPSSGKTTEPTTLDAGEVDLTWDAGIYQLPALLLTKTANPTEIGLGEAVEYTFSIQNVGSLLVSGITLMDDNATPDNPLDDIVIAEDITLAPGKWQSFTKSLTLPSTMCMSIGGVMTEVGTIETFMLDGGDVKVVYRQSRGVVDNTYGKNAVGYPRGHNFSDLLGSDKAQFQIYNGAGNLVLDFIMDYTSASSAFPSGYGCLGVTGGDGSISVGNAAYVKGVNSTLAKNLNQSPAYYGYTVDSPPEPDPNWDYYDGYEFVIDAAAFGASGFGGVKVPSVHNSPSKLAFNQVLPKYCGNCLTNTAHATGYVDGTVLVTASSSAAVCRNVPCTDGATSLSADFNSTAIPAGRHIWFNSVVKVDKRGGAAGTVEFNDVTVEYVVNGVSTTVPVPPSRIIFDATVNMATTTFDGQRWITRVPLIFTGNVFLTGLSYPVPAPGLPKSLKGVKMSGRFSSNLPAGEYVWKWAAAVYDPFSTDYNALGVKPIDGDKLNDYKNRDLAGTPENFKANVKPGARGGGGSNYTGNYTGTKKILTPCPLE